jgi:membrane-associated protease RseP (regulator of RpoE activity)
MNEEKFSPPVLTEIPRFTPEQRTQARSDETELWKPIPPLNLVLFLLTLLTTTMAGAYLAGAEHPLSSLRELSRGLPFSLALMMILLCHELGHYVTARYHRVNTSLPYFIPVPFPSLFMVGTFGAFIRMKTPPQSRRVMFDVGAAGPWAGMIPAIIAVYVGLRLSDVTPLDKSLGGLELGDSLLFSYLTRHFLGVDPNSVMINLHPIAFAGWLGLFITSLNLLPVGQLDGGHVVYALFGRNHAMISRLFVLLCFVVVGGQHLLGLPHWDGWLMWGFLLLFLGLSHPRAVDQETPLNPGRRVLAWLTIVLFIITLSPVPFSLSMPEPGGSAERVYEIVSHGAHALPLLHSM